MHGCHAELFCGREVGRGVVGEDALAGRDPELIGGDEVDGGVRLARSGVPRDDHGVEDVVQVVPLVRVVLAVAPGVRQQPDPDPGRAGALDQVQDLTARTQAAERTGQQAVVVDPEQPPDRHLELALRNLARLRGFERRLAFLVLPQSALERAGVET
jgi:hypothetical protein